MLLPRARLALPAALLAALLTLPVAHAQDGQSEASSEAASVRPSNAAFMQPLGRLANIMGSMHFLRGLCEADDAGLWRDKMNELIAAQNPNEADRRILIAQFNGGYRAFESTYRSCTPAASLAIRRYLDEGEQLSRDISARYGN